MNWYLILTLLIVGAFYAAIRLAAAYPIIRLRGILDGSSGNFSMQMTQLDGRYNGRLVRFLVRWSGVTRWGTARGQACFSVTLHLQSSSDLSPEKQTALASAKVSFNKAEELVESLTRARKKEFGYSDTSAPWVEAWVNQPEVHDALYSIFRNSGAHDVKLADRAFWSYSFAPLLAARRQNVQALLKGLIALDESLVKAVPGE